MHSTSPRYLYSAPPCQVNFWIPIYEIESGRSMAFHRTIGPTPYVTAPKATTTGMEQDKPGQRGSTHQDRYRVQPKALEPVELEPQVRVITKWAGFWSFQAPICTRPFPILGKDAIQHRFRTVHIDDVTAFRGAHTWTRRAPEPV